MTHSEIFDGRASEMRESPWLASEDLDGIGEKVLTIKQVHKNLDVSFEAGRKKDVVYSVEFERAKRQLVLNGTNRKSLQALFGNNVNDWAGQKITLYVKQGIKVGGQTKPGLRVKGAE
jgi:hypothetical protein